MEGFGPVDLDVNIVESICLALLFACISIFEGGIAQFVSAPPCALRSLVALGSSPAYPRRLAAAAARCVPFRITIGVCNDIFFSIFIKIFGITHTKF